MSNKPNKTSKDLSNPSILPQHPNFFIIGAAKSGTTSLWMYLKQHPEVYMPPTPDIKEPSFFCNTYGYKDFEAYLGLFSDAKEVKAIGEASHAYLTSPESAAWIREVYPEAKIIIILRNPVQRAYSLYHWMIREGYEWITPFEKALITEEERLNNQQFKYYNPQYYYNYLYFSSGCYAAQIERYLNLFPRQQIYITLFEDIKHNPITTTQAIYDFLGVDTSFIPQIKIYNKTQIPLSISAQHFIKQELPRYMYKLRIPAVRWIQETALTTNLFLGKFRSISINAATQRKLREQYKENIQKTANLIERDLSVWLETN